MDANAHIFFCGMFVKLFVAAYVFLPMQTLVIITFCFGLTAFIPSTTHPLIHPFVAFC